MQVDPQIRAVVERLDSDDRALAERVLQDMSIAGHAKDLTHLFGAWAALVSEIEEGYDRNIYEYLNDVSARRILDRMLAAIPDRAREYMLALLRPFDERFVAATRPIDRHLGTGIANLDNPPSLQDRPDLAGEWFYTRVPHILPPELMADLRDSGL